MAKRVSSPNYSTLIKELKSSSSILDKTKSKNIKTYMRSMKTFEKSPTNISTFNKASETKGLLKERKRNEYNLDGKIDIKISLNYNKETEEGINEAKFSRVQPKEKLITSLKTSSHLRKKTISDPFSSKPLLNSSNIHKRYSSEINNNVSISLVNYHNSNMCKYPSNSSSFITKNHQQSKTVMKRNESISNTITMNDFTLNKSGAIHKDLGTCMMSPTNKKLELRLNDMLKGVYDSESLKDGYNITKKKLNVYRKIFSEYISTCTEGRDFLMMVYDGLSYSIEEMLLYNKSLQGKIKENLSIGANYKTISKKYHDVYKSFQLAKDEIKILREKLDDNEAKPTECAKLSKENEIISIPVATCTKQILNKSASDDLDSIYFVDKIQMRAKSVSTNTKVPKLNLDFDTHKRSLIPLIKPLKFEIEKTEEGANFHQNKNVY